MSTGDSSFLPEIPSLWEIRKGRRAFVISGIFPHNRRASWGTL